MSSIIIGKKRITYKGREQNVNLDPQSSARNALNSLDRIRKNYEELIIKPFQDDGEGMIEEKILNVKWKKDLATQHAWVLWFDRGDKTLDTPDLKVIHKWIEAFYLSEEYMGTDRDDEKKMKEVMEFKKMKSSLLLLTIMPIIAPPSVVVKTKSSPFYGKNIRGDDGDYQLFYSLIEDYILPLINKHIDLNKYILQVIRNAK